LVAIAAFGVSYALGWISIRQGDDTITIENQPVRSILMRKKLHIRNLPAKVSRDELNELFESHGTAARFERIDESEEGYGRSGYV
jgi:hypothetical protein